MPAPSLILPLKRPLPPVWGAGALLKNTVALIQGSEAWLSADHGALVSSEALRGYRSTITSFAAEAAQKPVAVAHDRHPDFLSTHEALGMELPCVPVQHHHAHIAAVMAEYGLEEPVLGLALDGFGLGLRNEAWGGELLVVDRKGFRRVGFLRRLPQPGGDVAARQPWRMGAAALWGLGRGDEIAERYKAFPESALLQKMMDRGLNSPMISSGGRLFDAVCGLLGVKLVASFEGEAPVTLEGMAKAPTIDPEGWRITQEETPDGPAMVLDFFPLLDRLSRMKAEEGANLFHGTLVAGLTDWVAKAAEETGLRKLAGAGGCFFNKVLRARLQEAMMQTQMTFFLPQKLSYGDAAISLGQAYAAALHLEGK